MGIMHICICVHQWEESCVCVCVLVYRVGTGLQCRLLGLAGRGSGLWSRLQCWSNLEHYLVAQHREYCIRGLVSSIRRNLITLLKI